MQVPYFYLGADLDALEIEKIKEIRVGYKDEIDPVVPLSFPVTGVMELRQEILPIIDLSLMIGIQETQNRSQARTTIVVETVSNKQKRKCGNGVVG